MEITTSSSSQEANDISIDPAMKIRTHQKPSNCPWCGSTKIALLLSGMPVFIPELENALDGGGIAIGSFNSGSEGPAWQCTDCCAQFFRDASQPS
jgi:hypothetical protein